MQPRKNKAKTAPIILASKSAARRIMLENAGLEFKIIPSHIDEAKIIKRLREDDSGNNEPEPQKIALELSQAKSVNISKNNPQALVIGSDQILTFEGKIISKAKNKNDAMEKLKSLRGKTHSLISSISVARAGTSIWSCIDVAHLAMKNFDDNFLNNYIEKADDALLSCVGAYQIEGRGAWLFSKIEGDFFTIMGMPLLPLLSYLNDKHEIEP